MLWAQVKSNQILCSSQPNEKKRISANPACFILHAMYNIKVGPKHVWLQMCVFDSLAVACSNRHLANQSFLCTSTECLLCHAMSCFLLCSPVFLVVVHRTSQTSMKCHYFPDSQVAHKAQRSKLRTLTSYKYELDHMNVKNKLMITQREVDFFYDIPADDFWCD